MSGLELSGMSWFWVKSKRVWRKLNRERWEYDEVLSGVQRYRGQCLCKNRVCSVLHEERDYEYVWIAWTMKQARCMEPLLTESSIHPFFWGSVKVCEIKDTCKGRMKEGTWLGVTSRIPLISSIYLPYISSKVSIYLLHTGQKSIWKPIPRPSSYESFEKDPLQAPQ